MAVVTETPYTIGIPSQVAFNPELTPGDMRVYMALTHFARGGLHRPTQAGISELVGLGRSYIGPSLHRLQAAGAITIDTSAVPYEISIAA